MRFVVLFVLSFLIYSSCDLFYGTSYDMYEPDDTADEASELYDSYGWGGEGRDYQTHTFTDAGDIDWFVQYRSYIWSSTFIIEVSVISGNIDPQLEIYIDTNTVSDTLDFWQSSLSNGGDSITYTNFQLSWTNSSGYYPDYNGNFYFRVTPGNSETEGSYRIKLNDTY